MPLRVAIQMDALSSINPKSDSTLLMAREAQARGHDIFYYTPEHLTYREGSVLARGRKVKFLEGTENFYTLGELWHEPLHDMDVILLRQDPPFNMTYLSTTYLLEQVMTEALVVNNPVAVRNFPEKIFPTLLEHAMPPTLITADVQAIEEFRRDEKDIVIKPLYGYGGRAVLRIKPDDQNFHALMEMIFTGNKEPVMVQRFLPEVATDDKRIILLDGEIAGALGRIPASGDVRANMRVGGTPVKTSLSAKQLATCEELGEMLREEGILFAGVDMIGDYLTEVNTTSPTGFAAINALYGVRLESNFWDVVEGYIG
ncbi:MAG: glutathione synthase [Alphaproteobacteria bacterium]|nr:glutathione synthase [Alphaproteobacteria bacterium]